MGRSLELFRSEQGVGSVETNEEGAQPEDLPSPGIVQSADLKAALDCDLGLCPLTITMPIRRLTLLETQVPKTQLIMTWIDIPSLQVIASDQYYSSVDAETAYIKYARTASGGVSVQVVRYKVGRIEVLKHFGTAHNDLSLDHLIDQAEDFLGTNAQLTLDNGVEPPARSRPRMGDISNYHHTANSGQSALDFTTTDASTIDTSGAHSNAPLLAVPGWLPHQHALSGMSSTVFTANLGLMKSVMRRSPQPSSLEWSSCPRKCRFPASSANSPKYRCTTTRSTTTFSSPCKFTSVDPHLSGLSKLNYQQPYERRSLPALQTQEVQLLLYQPSFSFKNSLRNFSSLCACTDHGSFLSDPSWANTLSTIFS